MEDADKCVTALYLNRDGTVSFGATDGPLLSKVSGAWEQDSSTGDVAMSIKRTYPAGNEKRRDTDVGEFHFSTERILVGEVCHVGASLGVKGQIHMQDEIFGDEQVGYFSMIDTTNEWERVDELEEELQPQSI